MDIVLGSITARHERPQTLKFAWPIIVLPELFATQRHLAVLTGYLASIGWEIYAIDLASTQASQSGTAGSAGFAQRIDMVEETIAALGREAIVLGHGLGGTIALKMAERARIKAAVAIAPLAPGFRSPLFVRQHKMIAFWRSESFGLPTGQLLFDLVADADPFQRDAIIRAFVPGNMDAAIEVARGEVRFASDAAPRLVVAGDSDVFAPHEHVVQFAKRIGAQLATLNGRGHWLIGGRALERAMAEIQRFLVRTLGQDLLLLYPEEIVEEPPGGKEE